MPVPVILAGAAAVAGRLAAKKIAEQAAKKAVIAAARKKGLATPAQKAALKKTSANSAKAAAKVEKRAMKNINKPVPLSNKPLGKLTVMKPSGLKKPVPQTNKWSDGGNAKLNAATNARTTNTMRPLTSLEKAGFTKAGNRIGGVKVQKASADTARTMNAARTQQGTARQANAIKTAEEIRKAKATQRLLEIKRNTKFK